MRSEVPSKFLEIQQMRPHIAFDRHRGSATRDSALVSQLATQFDSELAWEAILLRATSTFSPSTAQRCLSAG
jgi:hypothetical protein